MTSSALVRRSIERLSAIAGPAPRKAASVLNSGRTWLPIMPDPIVTAVRGCELSVPPTPTHGHQKLDRVLVALCLRANITELRLLILPLRIEQADDTRTAAAVADALQTYGL